MKSVSEVRRVHIIGGPGSGKTTLARILGAGLRKPTYDLDVIGYEGRAGPKRPLRTRLDDVQCIAGQSGWVTKGMCLWWTEALFRHADVIVWLDVPFRVAAWRIVVRHVKAERRRNNPHTGWRSLARFLRNVQRYHGSSPIQPVALDDDVSVTRAATADALRPHGAKVHVCHAGADIRRVVCALLKHG